MYMFDNGSQVEPNFVLRWLACVTCCFSLAFILSTCASTCSTDAGGGGGGGSPSWSH